MQLHRGGLLKSWVSDRRLAAGIFALVLLGSSSTAFAAVGRTPGTYQVSPTGAATYTIPIWAPWGPNGLEPHISLVYNSQQGTGYMGIGWSVAGISSIYRCNLTYAQDAAPAPVALTTSDGLCLDGRRLRLVSGTQGEGGSTYQTEIANFENVTADGTAGNGPAYFVVQAPDGTQYEYGNTTSSQVLASGETTALQWYLDKVTDTSGNTMTFSYSTGTGSAVPETISWTPTSYGATTYSYTMTFGYGTNADTSSINAYVAGTQVVNTNLLTSITIAYGGTTVKKYALTYQQSPTTGRDELTQVEECADSAQTNCLAPTTITYQNGAPGTQTAATTALSSAPELSWNYDFNADGFEDLAFCTGGSPNTIEVSFGSSNGYGAPINTGIPCEEPYGTLFGDLLGTGQDGILANNGGTWYYYTWNGSSFSGVSTGLAYDSTSEYTLSDVNGDGLPDLVETKVTTNTGLAIYVRLNASSGSTVAFSSDNALWFSTSDTSITAASVTGNTNLGYGRLRRLDFNGDGRDDLSLEVQDTTIVHTPDGQEVSYKLTLSELISTSTNFVQTTIAQESQSGYIPIEFLNFNSDACTDYLLPGNGSTTDNILYISGCNGSLPETVTFGPALVIGAMDWNGDGLTDILVQNGSTIGVYESTGNGLSSLISTSVPYSSSNTYFTFDADGDGLDDLGVWGSSAAVSYFLHNGDGQKPDLLSSVTDGYGNFTRPTYVSTARAVNSTYFEWNDAEYPYQNYMGPLYIVNQTTFSDPSNPPNGTYQQLYFYAGAWTNLQGRGFAGFGNFQLHDLRNGTWVTYGYGRAFPYTGILNGEVATQNNTSAETIFNGSYTLSDTTLDGTQYEERYFPYVSSSTEKYYEVGGVENGDLITTKTASYSYDDYGNVTAANQTITDNDSGSPYDGDSWTTSVTNTPDVGTSEWCLNLLGEAQISYSASNGSPSVTRTREYTPDTTHCRYTQIKTEPSSNSYEVTEALGYDDFGNINSDSVTGIGMTARQTSANWGTTGQFPMSVTDASGATTQFNYDFSYGLVSNETDPNGLTTSWAYGDGFGRLTQETRPDGTYTTYAYNNCASEGGCLMGANTLELSHYNYNTDGNIETDGTTYFDELERPIVWNNMMLSETQWNRNEVRYDSLGRVVQRAAPCVWSALTTPCSYWTTMGYDILNRLTEVQRPINENDSTPQTTSYAYEGRTTTVTDPYGNTKTLIRDVNGWLRETKDALGYSIILGYDAAGAKTSVTDSLGNTLWTGTYAYGIAPFLVGESGVDRGTWGYTVDALGERTAWTDPKGKLFYQSYDALSRPISRAEPDLFTHWIWGATPADHNVGKLLSVCTGSGYPCSSSYYYSETETYDSLGRLYQRSIAIPSAGTYTYTWQYSATTGLLNTLTYPVSTSGQALELQYAYQAGILASITDILDSPNVTVWQANAENPAGQITQETAGNGLVTSRAYDAVTHWLSSVQSGPGGGSSVQNQSFLYDEVGAVTQRQDNNLGLSENFYYDADYRLSYSTLGGTQNLSLSYSPMGNITSRSDVAGGATWTYDPVHLHEVTEAGSGAYQYVYDPNGNVTSRQGSSISWSSYNYPTTINDTATGESVSFLYGPDRRAYFEQTQSSSGTETNYHVGGLLDIVSSGGVTDYRHYIYAGSEPVAIDSRKSSGTNAFYYLLSDHQGSIAAITNSTGGVVVGESFTAYGSRRNPTTWSGAPSSSDLSTIAGITRQAYTFQDALGQMGLNDMIGRVQDAVTGRFLSADPRIADPTDPQEYNLYSYVHNNPLTYVDPTGFDCNFGPDGTDFSIGCTVTAPPIPALCADCVWEPYSPGHPWPGPYPYPYSPPHSPPQPRPPSLPHPSPPRNPPQQTNPQPQKPPCGGAVTAQVGGAVNLAVLFGVQINIELGVTTNGQFYVSGGVQPSWGAQVGVSGSVYGGGGYSAQALPSGFSTSYAVTGTVQGVYGLGGGEQVQVGSGGGSYAADTRLSAGEYVSAGAVGTQESLTLATPAFSCNAGP
jgi:RHS repeat-associated protein